MRRLCRSAHIITPNWTEATLLAGVSGPRTAGQLLEEIGVQNAVITGVRSGGRIGYAARLDNQLLEIDKPYVDIPLHGTGDVFASSFCGELLSGKSKAEALKSAADFCDECVRATAKRQPAHWYGLSFEDVLKRGKNV